MYKQSPSRGHKSKGIKVKHVLQICLLLAVCFWLVYQVKHSQDKRREFDAKGVKVVDKVQTESEIIRFGRKDLPRDTERATGGDKHGDDEEEKVTEEVEEEEEEIKPEEEENKHKKDEPGREDTKTGETEEERESGDDETDENEAEKESEHENVEEQDGEDKEREDNEEDAEDNHDEKEEKEFPGKEEHFEAEENEDAKKDHSESEEIQDVGTDDRNERDAASDDQDRDGDNADTHEAQEELYKADDASSEVAHHVQNINPETVNVTMGGHASDMFGKVNFGQENETKSSDNPNDLIKTDVEPREDSDGISNGTSIDQNKYENIMTKSDGGALQNSTSAVLPNIEASNSSSLGTEHPSLSNGTETVSDVNVSRNAYPASVTVDKDLNLPGNVLGESNKLKLSTEEHSEDSGNPNKTENAFTNDGDSLSSSNTTVDFEKENDTDTTGAGKNSLASNKDRDEKVENDGVGESDESSSSHSSAESEGAIQHDPIDASDINVSEEERESRIDLDTLPGIKTEVQNEEEAMAE